MLFILLLLHIVAAVFAFGPVLIHPLMASLGEGSAEEQLKLSNAMKNVARCRSRSCW